MEWRDTGFVLATRRHGESALIAELLTREHGRHSGLVRGGQSPRRRALFQPGNHILAHWRGRLPEHLGSFDCELVEAYAVRFLDDADRLAAVTAAAALLLAALPEREPNVELYQSFAEMLTALESNQAWPQHYVEWECGLLAMLGFGLDLSHVMLALARARLDRAGLRHCSVRQGDIYDLALPRDSFDVIIIHQVLHFLDDAQRAIAAGLALTGYFLLHHLLEPHGRQLPEARERLAERMRRPERGYTPA